MVNPGTFIGSRKEFLLGEKPAYASGVANNCVPEALSLIYRRFFKRFPVDLPLNIEPPAEHLAAVDDNAADPEPERNVDDAKRRKALIKRRKGQIQRWMNYQYVKDTSVDGRSTGANNPYNVLLRRLTGRDVKPPRKKSAANIWRKTAQQELASKFQKHLEKAAEDGEPIPTRNYVSERDQIARDTFAALPQREQKRWAKIAEENHALDLQVYQEDLNAEASTDPEDRQRAIQGLSRFVQPILDQICLATGWKATLIVGGPEPAQGGRLNVLSVHSGTITGDIKMNFGYAERRAHKEEILPIYARFLRKCYSTEECRARAIPPGDGAIPAAMIDPDFEGQDSTFMHSIPDIPNSAPSNPTPGFSLDVSMPTRESEARPPLTDLEDPDDHPFPYSFNDGECERPWSPAGSAPLSSAPPSPRISPADDENDMTPYVLPGLPTAPVLVAPGLQLVTAQGHTTVHFIDNPEQGANGNAQEFLDALAGHPQVPPQPAPPIPQASRTPPTPLRISTTGPQAMTISITAPPPTPQASNPAQRSSPSPQISSTTISAAASSLPTPQTFSSARMSTHPPPPPTPPQLSFVMEPQAVTTSAAPALPPQVTPNPLTSPVEQETLPLNAHHRNEHPPNSTPNGYIPTLNFLKARKAAAVSSVSTTEHQVVAKATAPKKRKRTATPEPTELGPRSRKKTEKGKGLDQEQQAPGAKKTSNTNSKKKKGTSDPGVAHNEEVVRSTTVKRVVLKLPARNVPTASGGSSSTGNPGSDVLPEVGPSKRRPGRPKKVQP